MPLARPEPALDQGDHALARLRAFRSDPLSYSAPNMATGRGCATSNGYEGTDRAAGHEVGIHGCPGARVSDDGRLRQLTAT